MTAAELEKMKAIDLDTVNPEELVDIRTIKIDSTLPREQRVEHFLAQIKNPYCFKCGKMVIKMHFADTNVTLEDKLESYLRTLGGGGV